MRKVGRFVAESSEHLEWIERANGDAEGARLLLANFKPALGHLIAFSCQQAAEKYLKAVLIHDGVAIPRTHDLVQLQVLCAERRPDVASLEDALAALGPFAVNVRYPGSNVDRALCEDAFARMSRVQAYCLRAVGFLPSE